MVTLQGNLGKEPLRLISLETWHTFVSMLRFRDISPHVGPTTAAFVTYWSKFTPEERAVAAKTINYLILENADSIKEVLNDIVSLDGIAELRKAAQRLRDARQSWDDEKLTRNLLRRAEDDNTIISFRSLQELKLLLLKQGVLSKFASGDSFNPIVGELIRTLLRSTARDGEADDVEDLRDVSLECLGIVGALDPDRFSAKTMEESARITDNLSTYDDASCFAIHLMENLLVSAFRATNDTRYQESLAYTIQELNQFCGFTKDLVDSSNKGPRPSIFSKVREKWNKIQATKQTVLADMLTTKYSIKTTDHKPSEQLPIYPLCPTYREWIQKWTSDLIFKTKGEYAEQIFTVFRAVVRNQDVHVARYLLPYLIINHCTNGDKARQDEVIDEIRTVLEDQVNPTANSSPDRRLLSAQVCRSSSSVERTIDRS
jgi:serine/threonine-protein kinase ATR